jgi:hypothetical protein
MICANCKEIIWKISESTINLKEEKKDNRSIFQLFSKMVLPIISLIPTDAHLSYTLKITNSH